MIALVIFLTYLLVALGIGVLAAWSDFRGLVIPNIYSAAVLASFVVAYVLLWILDRERIFSGLGSHLLSALVMFGITAGLFAVRAIGGADSKLATAYALWTGLVGMLAFVFYMALAGGLLGLAALALRKWKPVKNPRPGGWIARVQAGENKVPYGAAIVCGALASFVKLGYLGPEAFTYFLSS